MIAPVALGQVRFCLPGLLADQRGVVTGREMAVRLPTLDRLVWFLRLLAAAGNSDECWAGMRAVRVRSPVGTREVLVVMPVPSTHAADSVSRAAHTAGGQCTTGSGRHFVEYRDARAPLGYDVLQVFHGEADFVLYGFDQAQPYRAEGEMQLGHLILGLDLVRSPGSLESSCREVMTFYATARQGLGPRLASYLLRHGVSAQAASLSLSQTSAFGPPAAQWLFRIDELPPQFLNRLAGTPGVALYYVVTGEVAVAVGYRHPLHLAACRAVLPGEQLHLLSPRPAGVTSVALPSLMPIEQLQPIAVPKLAGQGGSVATSSRLPRFEIPLRLVRATGTRRYPRAAWIPLEQARWLGRLCYALPATALREHRLAVLDDALLLTAADRLAAFPFGQLLDEVAPGVLVPTGSDIAPALLPEQLAKKLGTGQASWLVFPSWQGPPVRVPVEVFETLDRRVLAGLKVEGRDAVAHTPRIDEDASLEVQRTHLGRWQLWGGGRG